MSHCLTYSILRQKGIGYSNPLLDKAQDAAVAFSLRKLKTDYAGNCVKVRRDSDSATQDIGFTVSGVIDLSALTTFVGAGNGYIDTWYDQSGNGINATQTATASQPIIINAGSVVELNSNPSISFDGVNDWLLISGLSNTGDKVTVFEYCKKNSSDTNTSSRFLSTYITGVSPYDFASESSFVVYYNNNSSLVANMRNGDAVTVSHTKGNGVLIFACYDGSYKYISVNGGVRNRDVHTGNFGYQNGRIGNYNGVGSNNYLGGYVSELLVYNSDLTSKRNMIINNINTFYNIY